MYLAIISSKETYFLCLGASGSCGDPGHVANAVQHGGTSGSSFPVPLGTRIRYACDSCYSGGGTVTCLGSGRWTTLPSCTGTNIYLRSNLFLTRMHSSRMRTGRSLTVCCSLLPGGGGGECLLRGEGVCSGGCAWSGGVLPARGGSPCPETPPVNRITHTCKNITLGHNFIAAGNKKMPMFSVVCVCLSSILKEGPHVTATLNAIGQSPSC